MSLTRKSISMSKARFLGWLCCSPCVLTCGTLCGLVACVTCGKHCAEPAVNTLCFPCVDSPADKIAHSISTDSLSFAFFVTQTDVGLQKLKALDTENWKASELFTRLHLEDNFMQIHRQLKDYIYEVLNEYDFGRIDSSQLTDTQFISNLLRTAIFTKLPEPAVFFESARNANIDVNNPAVMNGVLLGAISRIITREFIFNELNTISPQYIAYKDAEAARLSANRNIIFTPYGTVRNPPPAAAPAPQVIAESKVALR